jgi:hypothetical protein
MSDEVKNSESLNFIVTLIFNDSKTTIGNDKIKELYFIEDINSVCKTGYISFYDEIGIMEFGPITGNEKIHISFGYKDIKEYTFYFYQLPKITQVDPNSPDKSIITLHFTETLFFNLNFNNYSYS